MSMRYADAATTDYEPTSGFQVDTPVPRWKVNIEAIKLLKRLEAEGRGTLPAEEAVLAKYSGFGNSAFQQGFPYYRSREPTWGRTMNSKTLTQADTENGVKFKVCQFL